MITKNLCIHGCDIEVTLPEDVWEQISEQQISARYGIKAPAKAAAPVRVKKVAKK